MTDLLLFVARGLVGWLVECPQRSHRHTVSDVKRTGRWMDGWKDGRVLLLPYYYYSSVHICVVVLPGIHLFMDLLYCV